MDGWWAEGYDGTNGWAIPQPGPDEDADQSDAEHFYSLLEEQIIPQYYSRDERGIPAGWVDRMRNAMRQAGTHFTARRMVCQYVENYYLPAIKGHTAPDDPPTA
jgi:starch phosphorylase